MLENSETLLYLLIDEAVLHVIIQSDFLSGDLQNLIYFITRLLHLWATNDNWVKSLSYWGNVFDALVFYVWYKKLCEVL